MGTRLFSMVSFIITCTFYPSSFIFAKNISPLALTWQADVYMVNFDQEQKQKVYKAVEIIKKIIRGHEFKERIIKYSYKGRNHFVDNKGLSNEQIYQIILNGSEKIGNTTKNNTMDVELELYQQASKTIGYTYPNTTRIWINQKYFHKYTPEQVADNLMHEWLHKLGFTHSVQWNEDRDHSVPYAVGYLIEELALKTK